MRWPFRRAAADAGAGTDAPAPAAAASAPAAEWRTLPALQRVSAELTPVAPLDAFADSLPTHQDPRFLAPLAHALTPEAPAGEVTGLADPVRSEPPSVREFEAPRRGVADAPVQRAPEPAVMPSVLPVQRAALPAVEPRPVPALPDVVVSRTAAVPVPDGPVAPLVAGGASEPAPVVDSPATAADPPVVARAVHSEPPGPAPDLPPVRPVAGPGPSSGGGSGAGTSDSGSASEVAVPATPADVVQRTTAAAPRVDPDRPAPGAPQSVPPMPPMPIVSRAAVNPPAGRVSGPAGGPADAPLIGSDGMSPLVAALGGTGTPEPDGGAPTVTRTAGSDFPTVSRTTAGGTVDLPTVSRTTAGGTVDLPAVSRASGQPSVAAADRSDQGVAPVPTSGDASAPSSGPSDASAASGSGPADPGLPVVSRTPVGGAEVPTLGRASEQLDVVDVGSSDASGGGGTGGPGAGLPVVSRTPVGGAEVPTLGRASEQLGVVGAGLPVVSRTTSGSGDEEPIRQFLRAGSAPATPEMTTRSGGVGPTMPIAQRSVALPVAPARLLWPAAPASGEQVPLTSERPLTVPHDAGEHAELPPAVQRVSFDPPGTPAAPRPEPVPLLRVPERVAQPEPIQRLEQHTPELASPEPRSRELPAPRPHSLAQHSAGPDVARALPLQRMFGDQTTTGSSEPVQEMSWQPPVQRDEIGTSPAAEAPLAPAPVVQAAAAPAAPAAPGAPATDLDEMAKRLYEPLTARLRAELWLDRERAGLVTDRRY